MSYGVSMGNYFAQVYTANKLEGQGSQDRLYGSEAEAVSTLVHWPHSSPAQWPQAVERYALELLEGCPHCSAPSAHLLLVPYELQAEDHMSLQPSWEMCWAPWTWLPGSEPALSWIIPSWAHPGHCLSSLCLILSSEKVRHTILAIQSPGFNPQSIPKGLGLLS